MRRKGERCATIALFYLRTYLPRYPSYLRTYVSRLRSPRTLSSFHTAAVFSLYDTHDAPPLLPTVVCYATPATTALRISHCHLSLPHSLVLISHPSYPLVVFFSPQPRLSLSLSLRALFIPNWAFCAAPVRDIIAIIAAPRRSETRATAHLRRCFFVNIPLAAMPTDPLFRSFALARSSLDGRAPPPPPPSRHR